MNAAKRKNSGLASSTFLTRLGRDQRGNTLALVGAALLPLTAMIGSGLDMSRAYMAKTRLQSACDAAALAGRRVLVNDTLTESPTDPVRVEAEKFFSFNFPDNIYETAAFTPVVTRPEAGVIHVDAETTIPTSVMHLFGFQSLELSVSCEASQNFVNTDVVLVLDITGSMLCETDGSDCDGDSNSKIAALREAVLALYDELAPVQTQLEAAGMRLRYGVVPYSSGVNVGQILMQASPAYVAGGTAGEQWTYQSRSATAVTSAVQGDGDDSRRRMCTQSSGVRPRWDATYSDSTNQCTYYPAQQRTIDVSAYVATLIDDDPLTTDPAPIDIAPLIGGSSRTVNWAGCIEERQSVNTITSASGYAIPEGALDLDIDFIPTDLASKWKPYWPEVSFRQDNSDTSYVSSNDHISPQVACPTPSKRLQAWERDDLEAYLDSFAPTGGTYHDNGMLWGARLISAGGVFADSPDEFLEMPVTKHIIFMTDGQADTGYDSLYTTYGIEKWDQRVGGTTESAQLSRHQHRFKMVCNSVKSKNVSIWVIQFASGANQSHLTECASSASQISKSTNKAQLIAKFAEIGKNIGALRLTQ